jgi:hypothetical protein
MYEHKKRITRPRLNTDLDSTGQETYTKLLQTLHPSFSDWWSSFGNSAMRKIGQLQESPYFFLLLSIMEGQGDKYGSTRNT